MSYLITANYDQMWLFPPTLEELVPPDHPARFIRDFVGSLPLAEMGFRIPLLRTGAPAFAPGLVLGVWLYGYMRRIRSTRKLEAACRNDIGMMWLAGMHTLDHNTLWGFYRDNKQVLKKLFKRVVQVAQGCGLIGMVLHAVDGSKIAAACSRESGWSREGLEKALGQLDAIVAEAMAEIEGNAGGEEGEARLPDRLVEARQRQAEIRERLRVLEEAERDHLHPGEEDARMMKLRGGVVTYAYNAQAVADEESGMVVAQDVVTDESDNYQLAPMMARAEETLGATATETAADGGFLSGEALAEAAGSGYSVLVNMKEIKAKGGVYPTWQFTFDREEDRVVCPHGQALDFMHEKEKTGRPYRVRVYRCHQFKECPFRAQCTKDRHGRVIEVSPYWEVLRQQRQKQQDEQKRQQLRQRGKIIERVFGWVKENDGFRRFTMRGLENAKAQWALICATLDLRILYRHWLQGKVEFAAS